jgi:hypothetical protein
MRTHIHSLAVFAVTAGLPLSASPAHAAEALNPDPEVEPPRPPLPEKGFTLGVHLGGGYPFLKQKGADERLFALSLGARFGYRFTREFAAYLDATVLLAAEGYSVLVSQDGVEDRRPSGIVPVLAPGVAWRPVSNFELAAAPAVGIQATGPSVSFGGKGHVAVPIRVTSGRLTLSPLVEVVGLTGSVWKQVALTGGVGLDW